MSGHKHHVGCVCWLTGEQGGAPQQPACSLCGDWCCSLGNNEVLWESMCRTRTWADPDIFDGLVLIHDMKSVFIRFPAQKNRNNFCWQNNFLLFICNFPSHWCSDCEFIIQYPTLWSWCLLNDLLDWMFQGKFKLYNTRNLMLRHYLLRHVRSVTLFFSLSASHFLFVFRLFPPDLVSDCPPALHSLLVSSSC